MEVTETVLPDVKLIIPRVWRDRRGHFHEIFHADRYAEAGIPGPFVQDNLSVSSRGALRGLHFQDPNPQGKLVCVLEGEVFDVAVDVRKDSLTFGHWAGMRLSAERQEQMWIPEGHAHGFLVLSERAIVLYKCTALYAPECERSVRWDDPDIGVEWPSAPTELSEKDAAAPRLKDL